MAYKFSLEKQPAEKLTIGIDFAEDLGSGETISSASVSVIDLADDSDASATILDGSYQIQDGDQTSSRVAQKIKAGDDGKRYKITVQATTNAPHVFEADVVMTVRGL